MRILIVEDEHKIANAIKKGLELESYAVDVAYDGDNEFDLASSSDSTNFRCSLCLNNGGHSI